MPGPSSRIRRVRAPQMSSTDREFEDLLRRAADILKSRRSPVDREGTEIRESIRMPEPDSDI